MGDMWDLAGKITVMLYRRPIRRRGIYLLPNLFTTGGLFAGFYAIVASMQLSFSTACIAIFVAMFFDAVDGRVARMTNTQSPFGVQYDSLADLIAFGVAPALVAYSYSLHYLGKVGWLAAFVLMAAVALRLARFNVAVEKNDKPSHFFAGLPSPAAAAWMAAFLWLMNDMGWQGIAVGIIALFMCLIAAACMVSIMLYQSFKQIHWTRRVSFVTLLLMVISLVAIALNPPLVLFLGFSLYVGSGPVYVGWRKLRRRRDLRVQRQQEAVAVVAREDIEHAAVVPQDMN